VVDGDCTTRRQNAHGTDEREVLILGSVSPVANALQEAGLIRYSRGRIDILDLQGLQRASCECYSMVGGRYDRLLNH
jgi:hypothetical protein